MTAIDLPEWREFAVTLMELAPLKPRLQNMQVMVHVYCKYKNPFRLGLPETVSTTTRGSLFLSPSSLTQNGKMHITNSTSVMIADLQSDFVL